jgi:hypothetical protein
MLTRRDSGSVTGGRILDSLFLTGKSKDPYARRFPSVKDFHDTLIPHNSTYRAQLDDGCEIVFVHGDLHPSNILISFALDNPSASIVALVDWEQSGWMPEYWEYGKALRAVSYEGVWHRQCLPNIIDFPPFSTFEAFEYATYQRG